MRRSDEFVEPITGEEQEKVGAAETWFKSADAVRRREELIWLENIGMLTGNQWEAYQSDVTRWRKINLKASSAKVKITANLIYPLVRQSQSSLRSNMATNIAVPASRDEDDVQAAHLATKAIGYRYEADNEFEKRFHELGWKMTCGRCYRNSYWDADASSIGVDLKPMPGVGEIASETLNPFQVWLCPWADASKPIPWLIIGDVRPIDEINDVFKPKRKVTGEDYASVTANMDSLLSGIVEGAQVGAEKRKDAAIVKQLYLAPDAENPEGKLILWANGVILKEGPLPQGFLPIIALSWFPIPGKVYPQAFVTPLVSLQREINTTLSQLVTLKNNQIAGHIAMRGDGKVTQSYAVNEKGEKTSQKIVHIPYDAQDFQFMKYDLHSGEAEAMIERCWRMMQWISGQTDPSLGIEADAQRTLGEVLTLKESTMTGLTLFRENADREYADVDKQKLELMKSNYKIPRIISSVGADYATDVEAFVGADLLNTSDVRPKPAPIISETLKSQMIAEAQKDGLFGPYLNLGDKYAKLVTLRKRGIPDIDVEVDSLLSGETMEELAAKVAAIDEANGQLQILTLQKQIEMLSVPSQEEPNAPSNPEELTGADSVIAAAMGG